MCGLSTNQPYCNNSHKKTVDEEDNKIYAYEKKATKLKLRIGKWWTKSCHFVIIDSLHIHLRK
jgi:hypothetical protein